MPRKKLNQDQELIVYCLVARLRDKNYNSGFKGFDFVFDEIVQAVDLYIHTSGLVKEYRNKAREQFDGITLEEVEKNKAEGIVNTFRQSARNEVEDMYKYICDLVLPSRLEAHNMEFWGDTAKDKKISSYFNATINKLRYADGAFKKAGKSLVEGKERELIPSGRINKDNLSKFDTYFKKIGRFLQFDKELLEWITNHVKIKSPYSYRAVKPNLKSIIKSLEDHYGKEKLKEMETGYLVSIAVNKYELEGRPEYLLDEDRYKDLLQKTFDRYF